MTNKEAVNWLINITADIGKSEHRDLWHYEQALSEIKEMLESSEPEQKKNEWIPISKETNPTKSGWYLVTVHEDATIDNKRFTGIAEFNATNGVWYDIEEPTDLYLRWMPLPVPWEGKQDENRR